MKILKKNIYLLDITTFNKERKRREKNCSIQGKNTPNFHFNNSVTHTKFKEQKEEWI
jgi:hypothetical protein